MATTGADLENTSLAWLDKLAGLGDGTKTAQNAILANSVEQMLSELRGRYQKMDAAQRKDPSSRSNLYSGQQLAARIESSIDLLPSWKQKELTKLYERDLTEAQRLGADAGLNLDKVLKNRDRALNQNAKPNVDAINAANRRLNQFWEKENSQFTDRVKALTRNAAAQGMSWRQLEKQVRELLIIDRDQGTASDRSKRVNKRYGIPGRAEMIARTELAGVYINGQIDNMRRMGYDYGRWSAAAERTCGYCMSRDGLVYEIEELEQSLPAHPRCRCSIIPVDVPEKMRKKGPSGPDAAKDLDDAYWTKSRNEKLKQWKNENRGIRDPKTDRILNDMLRNFARTPTNTQRYLRPGAEAPKPFWSPSGQVIPSMGDAASNAKKAAEAGAKLKEARRLQDEADAAAKAAEEEAKRLAEEKAAEEARQLAEAEAIQAKAIAKIAELSKKYKLPEEQIQRAMNEARKAARLYGADKQETFLLEVKKAQRALKAAKETVNQKLDTDKHYIPTKSKQYVTDKMIKDAFEAHRKMPGLAGENFRKLEQLIAKHDLQMIFTNPANNPKNFNRKKYDALKEDWDTMRESPNFQRMIESNNKYWNQNEGIQKQFGANHASWQQDQVSTNPYSGRQFMTGGRSGAAGFTSGGASFVAVADWAGHKKITDREIGTIRDGYAKNFERRDNNWNLPWSARGDAPLGAKMGSKGQTPLGWMGTLVHEIGHQAHYRGGLKRLDGKNIDPGRFDPSRKNAEGAWEASQYGTTNQLENFAETLTLWVYQPDKLKQYSPEAYKWVDDHVRNALQDGWR